MGSIAFACGWVVVSTGANVAGIALGLGQFVWTVEAARLRLLTTCVVFLRRTPSAGR